MQDFDSSERAWERAEEIRMEAAEEQREREAAAAELRAFHGQIGDAIDERREMSPMSEAQSSAIQFAMRADNHLSNDMWSAACRDLDKAAALDDWWLALAEELPKLL